MPLCKEMEEEDYEQLLIPEEQSSPGQNRRLKRLKKAFDAPNSPLFDSLLQDDESRSPESSSKSLDSSKSDDGLLESEPRSGGFEREKESEEFDELFPWDGERSGAKRVLEFDDDDGGSGDGFGLSRDSEGVKDKGGNEGSEGIGDDKKGNRKRVKSNGDDKERKHKKKKKREDKSVGADGKPRVSKGKEKKERKGEVALLVEHQRQLRERRDVAFKPLSVVQKPVSSVLERIRQRKKQVSVKAAVSISNQSSDPLRDIMLDSDSEEIVIVKRESCQGESLDKNQANPTAVKDSHLSSSSVDGSDEDSAQLGDVQNSCKAPLVEDKEPSTAFRAPTSDTQDLFSESQTCETQDDLNAGRGSSQDEDLAPSLPSMNLKLDSAPFDDISSEEEESDKENVDPFTERLFKGNVSPKGDPVKEFVDEEALEEDYSDDDRRRFEDEGEDDSDAEEIAEMIATDYKEKPVDRERRDELHQLWLAQQDEAGTEHLLQKLKCGIKQKDATLLDEEDEGRNTDEMDDEFGNEGVPPTDAGRVNAKKLRQMIPQMFTDKEDGYISSDDEEAERRLNKQRLLGKVETKEPLIFVSPAEDETSGDVFGRIKKLNLVPETKKVKPSSFFENLVTKGSNGNSSKSSFLHRMSSIPVSSKRGSNTVKSFIFGRDDSNSRTSISTSEEEPRDVAENSSQRKRTFTAKFSSQARASTHSSAGTSHSTSLIDILKRSSVQATHFARDNNMVDHQAVFAAFKSTKRSLKIEARS